MTTATEPVPQPFVARLDEVDETISLITCSGELDIAAAPALKDAVRRSAGERLVVDLTDVEFMDSTGISVLLGAVRRYPGWRMSVCSPVSPPRRLLAVTAVEDLLLVRDTVDEAIAAVAASGRR